MGISEAELFAARGLAYTTTPGADPRPEDRPERQQRFTGPIWDRINRVNGHWLWMGTISGQGYPQHTPSGGRTISIHRYVFEICDRGLEDNEVLRKATPVCQLMRCVKPDHWRPVTRSIHMRTIRAGGRTRPRTGHEEEVTHRRSAALSTSIPYIPTDTPTLLRRLSNGTAARMRAFSTAATSVDDDELFGKDGENERTRERR